MRTSSAIFSRVLIPHFRNTRVSAERHASLVYFFGMDVIVPRARPLANSLPHVQTRSRSLDRTTTKRGTRSLSPTINKKQDLLNKPVGLSPTLKRTKKRTEFMSSPRLNSPKCLKPTPQQSNAWKYYSQMYPNAFSIDPYKVFVEGDSHTLKFKRNGHSSLVLVINLSRLDEKIVYFKCEYSIFQEKKKEVLEGNFLNGGDFDNLKKYFQKMEG